jgi:hypothetical protein
VLLKLQRSSCLETVLIRQIAAFGVCFPMLLTELTLMKMATFGNHESVSLTQLFICAYE